MKKILLAVSIAALLLSSWACKKPEEKAAAPGSTPTGPIMDTSSAPSGHGIPGKKTEFQIVVPPDVKEQWSKVVLVVEDKQENKTQEYTLNIGDDFNIPDTNLTVKIGPFLPDFKMSGTVITSTTSEPNNPSVGISVTEDGKKIFPSSGEWGWLYSNFPTIHSFQHDRIGLTLKEGIRKK